MHFFAALLVFVPAGAVRLFDDAGSEALSVIFDDAAPFARFLTWRCSDVASAAGPSSSATRDRAFGWLCIPKRGGAKRFIEGLYVRCTLQPGTATACPPKPNPHGT